MWSGFNEVVHSIQREVGWQTHMSFLYSVHSSRCQGPVLFRSPPTKRTLPMIIWASENGHAKKTNIIWSRKNSFFISLTKRSIKFTHPPFCNNGHHANISQEYMVPKILLIISSYVFLHILPLPPTHDDVDAGMGVGGISNGFSTFISMWASLALMPLPESWCV